MVRAVHHPDSKKQRALTDSKTLGFDQLVKLFPCPMIVLFSRADLSLVPLLLQAVLCPESPLRASQ